MSEKNKTFDFVELEKSLPPVVFRTYPHWREKIPFSPRTVANADAQGKGPKERIVCGRVIGYPRQALIEWLKERTRVVL